jgi:hypothetical protein
MWPSSVSAQPAYTPFWGLDGVYNTTTSVDVTIPTGYWWDNYYWNGYGGYNGWVYTSPYNYAWLNGWGGPSWYPGFADLDTYDWTYSQTLYKYSYYWDAGDVNKVLDITAFAGSGGLAELNSAQTQQFSFGQYPYHIWSAYYNGAVIYGQFSPLTWVLDDPADITLYMEEQGDSLTDINAFLASPAMQYLIYGDPPGPPSFIGMESTNVPMPEPASLSLLAVGGLGLMLRVRRSSK